MHQNVSGCRVCATFESDEQWRALPLVQSLGAEDLAAIVTTAWTGRVVEVRRCLGCGRRVARLVSVRTPAA